eukprot:TRINITY_DN4595_c0_g1_i1.p3 TRINITY_DN4595_c0_g1~~TRINITY_DN4595_c0_g1_i1.p3  ORF type:complete len:130 (-),score=16.17 TRINITY_DN4595_c0_g1_i1:653-1042(-)
MENNGGKNTQSTLFMHNYYTNDCCFAVGSSTTVVADATALASTTGFLGRFWPAGERERALDNVRERLRSPRELTGEREREPEALTGDAPRLSLLRGERDDEGEVDRLFGDLLRRRGDRLFLTRPRSRPR